MSSDEILSRLRRFLLLFSLLLFGGTLVELVLVGHWEDVIQFIPFGLCGLGAVASLAMLWRPRRATARFLRVGMGLVALGSLYGLFEHGRNNFAFEREIHPNAQTGDIILGALGGATPLLAPGILAAAAILALAATYAHPALSPSLNTDGNGLGG
jgi:hypothetical protein